MNKFELVVPSGDKYSIREQTGADDDIISTVNDSEADAINLFVAAIVIAGPTGKRLSLEDVEKMKLRDKYVIIIQSRIFSLSPKLIFGYAWEDGDEPVEYEEDLTKYVWDYSKPFPDSNSLDFDPNRIKPYTSKKDLQFSLASGKVISFMYLDGVGEKYLLSLKPHERTINKELVARGLKVSKDGLMLTVKNFSAFTAREMGEIRGLVDEYDPVVEANTDIEDPSTGRVEKIPLIAIKDFFFPVKF